MKLSVPGDSHVLVTCLSLLIYVTVLNDESKE